VTKRLHVSSQGWVEKQKRRTRVMRPQRRLRASRWRATRRAPPAATQERDQPRRHRLATRSS